MREAVPSRSGERGRAKGGAVLVWLLAFLSAGLLLAASASALSQRGHKPVAVTFAKEGSGDGELKDPTGVAVNEHTGNIYVVDSGNNRIVEFNAAHEFVRTWGWGVGTGAKEFQDCTSKCRAGLGGHSRGQFYKAEQIAIDQNEKGADPSGGDIYVESVTPYEELEGKEVTFEHTIIEKFTPEGELLTKGGRIKGYKEKGSSTEFFEEELHGLTIDPAGHLYVYNEESVIEYSNAEVNKFVRIVASEAEEGRPGIAVDTKSPPEKIFYLAREAEHAGENSEERPPVVARTFELKEGALPTVLEMLTTEMSQKETTGLAVDYANNDLVLDNVTSIGVFTPSAGPEETLERLGEGQIKQGKGVAATQNGDIFVADAGAGQIEEFEPEPAGAPQIDSSSVSEITQESAQLQAQVNPTGLASTFSFRYDTGAVPKTGEPCTSPCIETSAASVGEGATSFEDIAVSQAISGLTPDTAYHYRVIAANSSGTVESAGAFHTPLASSAVLPDGRRWEMVSPLNKNGASIEGPNREGGLIEASEDGEKLTYVAIGSFPDAEGNRAPEPTQILASRGGTEWSNHDIDPRQLTGAGLGPGHAVAYRFFSSELSAALLQPFGQHQYETPPLNEEPEVGQNPKHESTPYVRSTEAGCLTVPAPFSCFAPIERTAELTNGEKPNVPVGEVEVEGEKTPNLIGGHVNFLAADPAMKHLILQANGAALSPEPVGTEALYESTEGVNTLVSLLPGGKPAAHPRLGALDQNMQHALSADGSRVVWSENSVSTNLPAHLYLRDLTKGETLQLDVPEAGAETSPPSSEPVFQAASADDSRIFFTDEQRLTTVSSANSAKKEPDLYVCEIGENETTHKLECKLADLTASARPGESADVQGLIPGAGEDGNTVYFVADGALTEHAAPGHCKPQEESKNRAERRLPSTCNLYLARYDSETGKWSQPTQIATLSAEDEPDWGDSTPGSKIEFASRVSKDGNLLTFVSDRPLTGYDNVDAKSGQRDTEVFLFNAATEKLTCISCNPFGRTPEGVLDNEDAGEGRGHLVDRPNTWSNRWLSGTVPSWTHLGVVEATYPSRYLFNDGRVFFMSAEALVPQDHNGKEDVYEYEPPGVGGCTSESETYSEVSGGCVSLISSGTSSRESTFLDASASGNDVFFLTSEQLVPSDTDTNYDVYDATICGTEGSHACLPAPVISPPPCEEELIPCKPGATDPGTQFAAPASAAANGPRNSSAVEVLGSKETKATPTDAQLLAGELAKCKKVSNHGKRVACEDKAIYRYGSKAQKLNAALRSCHAIKKHKQRQACEVQARKKYGAATKAAHGARRGR